MNHSRCIPRLSILCALAGCSAATGSGLDTAKPAAKPSPAESANAALVDGRVASSFQVRSAEQCQPLGVPLTAYLTDAFAPTTLVDEEATAMSENECLHEQVLKASANSWATLAHHVLCGGGDDIRLCGVLDKRECSVEQLMKWAAQRSEPVFARDLTFGFDFLVPPQDEPARMALYRRAHEEVQTLLDEASQVMAANAAGTRDCPNESRGSAAEAYAKGKRMSRQLGDILSDDARDGS